MKKIVILGCENSHADTFLDFIKNDPKYSDVEVLGVHSEDEGAADKLKEKFGVKVLSSYDEAVGKVDGVMITARRGGDHYRFAKPYIASGVPMFIDKPVTISEAEAIAMAKDFEMGYLLDFYGEVLTPKQREMLNQYYNNDLSLSEIGENFGITRQGARDAIKHGETTLKELEAKVGFAARYRRVQEKLEELEQLVVDARFECTGPYAKLTTTEYATTLTKMLGIIRSMDEVNES